MGEFYVRIRRLTLHSRLFRSGNGAVRIPPSRPTDMEGAVEVEVAATIGFCGDNDLDLDDDLSIGAEVTCEDSDSVVSGVSILEELLKAENGNGDALACLQVNYSKIGLALVIGCRCLSCLHFATTIKRFCIYVHKDPPQRLALLQL